MTTLVESLQNATNRVNAAATLMETIRDQVAADKAAASANVTTIINNFNARPVVASVFCDPVNGNDAKDGSNIANAKKDIDKILEGLGSQSTTIYLLNDVTIRKRTNVAVSVSFFGIQVAATPQGFQGYTRKLTFLGTAENSPSPVVGSFAAGLFISPGNLGSAYIDFVLPDVPAGLANRSHFTFTANFGSCASLLVPTITVAGSQAGWLIGGIGFSGRVTTTMSPTLGPGVPGHLFEGIAAGQNPNSSWYYPSNVTSA